METLESIMLRLGFDAKNVTIGTQVMLDQQKKASMDYVATWEGALAKRDTAEKVALDKSWARYQANLEKKAAADKLFFEQQAARYAEKDAVAAIGAGSIPANMVRRGEGRLAADAEMAAAGAAGASIGNAGAIREAMVLLREGFRRNWTRMIGSFSLFMQYIGVTASTILGAIPIVGTGALAIWSAVKMRGSLAEQAGGYGTNLASEQSEQILQKRLEKIISELVGAGLLSFDKSKPMMAALKNGGASGIASVQRDLQGLIPAGGIEKYVKDSQVKARLDREHYELQKKLYREEETGQNKLNTLRLQRLSTWVDQQRFEKNSIEYKQHQIELDQTDLEIKKQERDVAREKASLEKEIADKQERIAGITRQMGQIDRAAVTVADLAGRSYTSRLNKDYGAGGRFDIADGNGPLGQAARDAELYAKQQMWDLTHGNYVQAEKDRQNQIAAENKLGAANIETPAMKAQALQKGIDAMKNDIAALLQQARTDGIVLKDKG